MTEDNRPDRALPPGEKPEETPEEYAERFERAWTFSQQAVEDLPDAEPSDDGLDALYDAALPADAPGAWVRAAIERQREVFE